MDDKRRKDYFKLINLNLSGKRVLEIGPRDGFDTMRLDKLNPKEIVLCELPSKKEKVDQWIKSIKSPNRVIFKNFMCLSESEINDLGKFDLIYFAGVLYHNPEQLRFLRKLYRMLNVGGEILLETEITTNPLLVDLNVVEICYPKRHNNTTTITHLPSFKCVNSWLLMVGFRDVVDYKPDFRNNKNRYTCVAKKTGDDDGDTFYTESIENFKIGDSN